jgi:hypothetical protein
MVHGSKWIHKEGPVNVGAARILEALDLLSVWLHPTTLRSLVRKMNANQLSLWPGAGKGLAEGRCVTAEAGSRRPDLRTPSRLSCPMKEICL